LAAIPDSFAQCAGTDFAVAANNSHDVVGKAPIAGQVFSLHGLALLDGEYLGDLSQKLLILALASQSDGTGAAIKTAGSNQLLLFTSHGYLQSVISPATAAAEAV